MLYSNFYAVMPFHLRSLWKWWKSCNIFRVFFWGGGVEKRRYILIYISWTKHCSHWTGVLGSHLITKNTLFFVWTCYYLQPILLRDSDIFWRTFHFFNSIKVRDETFLRTACFAKKKGTSIKVSHLNLLDMTVNNCRIEVSKSV